MFSTGNVKHDHLWLNMKIIRSGALLLNELASGFMIAILPIHITNIYTSAIQ